MGESSRVAPHAWALPSPARAAGRTTRFSLDRWFTSPAVLPTFVVMLLVFGLPLLNVDLPYIRAFRTALIVPMMITPIVGALCWKLLLLDGVAADWQRSLRRAGIRHG
jgi:ABC-type sugar transport system permease subunit